MVYRIYIEYIILFHIFMFKFNFVNNCIDTHLIFYLSVFLVHFNTIWEKLMYRPICVFLGILNESVICYCIAYRNQEIYIFKPTLIFHLPFTIYMGIHYHIILLYQDIYQLSMYACQLRYQYLFQMFRKDIRPR